jgi:hypothetical protein
MFSHTKRETGNGNKQYLQFWIGQRQEKLVSHWPPPDRRVDWRKRTFGAKRLRHSDASGIVTTTITRIGLRFRAVPDSVRKGVEQVQMLTDGVVVELLRRHLQSSCRSEAAVWSGPFFSEGWVCVLVMCCAQAEEAKERSHCKLHGTLKRPSCLSKNRWGSGALSPSPENSTTCAK